MMRLPIGNFPEVRREGFACARRQIQDVKSQCGYKAEKETEINGETMDGRRDNRPCLNDFKRLMSRVIVQGLAENKKQLGTSPAPISRKLEQKGFERWRHIFNG